MSASLSPQLALIALSEAATPGPWKVREGRNESQFFVQAPRIDPAHPYDIEILGEDDTLYPTRRADADFIVALVNDFRANYAQSRPEAELPELPRPHLRGTIPREGTNSCTTGLIGFTADQMRAYGQQCAATRPAEVGGDGELLEIVELANSVVHGIELDNLNHHHFAELKRLLRKPNIIMAINQKSPTPGSEAKS